MPSIFKNFPFTSILGIFGFLVGLFLLIFLDFSVSANYGKDPIGAFSLYFKESFRVLLKGAGLGLVVGVALGFAGLIIDTLKKKQEGGVSEPMPIQ